MTPQAQTVILPLISQGALTPVEATEVYRIRHLSSKMFELEEQGFSVMTQLCKDAVGQYYTRYFLASLKA